MTKSVMALGLALVVGACASDRLAPIAPDGTAATVAAIVPEGGAVAVDTATHIVLTFDHAMPTGMEDYVTLHHGGVTDSLVACARSWSADSLVLTMVPAAILRSKGTYTIHVGGGMMDAMGDSVGLAMHGSGMGGRWATGTMMNGGGMMGGGGPMAGQEMGMGWAGGNGTYGMLFTFTTD